MEVNSLEYRLKEDDQLCFIHIPKTAGTTFISVIDSKFNVEEISPELTYLQEMISVNQSHEVNLTPEMMRKYKFIRGHFHYSDVDEFLNKKPLYMTILRDPVERIISLYKYFKRAKEREEPEYHQDTKILRDATSVGLRGFVSDPNSIVKARIVNQQTRQLALKSGQGLLEELPDSELLALAKENLNPFIFLGLTERFQDSLFLLFYIFGWCPIASYQNLRVASSQSCSDELTSDTIELIKAQNQLDTELYRYAKEIFNARFSQMLSDLNSKYGQLSVASNQPEEILKLLEKHYEHRQAELKIPLLQAVNFDFLQPISGSGWHRRNGRFNGLKSSNTFRWTGPDTISTLDFPLVSDTDLVIKLCIINAATVDILRSLRLKVNALPIALKILKQKENLTVLQGMISQTVLDDNKPMTRLAFEVDRTVSLHSIDPNNLDNRLVGIALQKIQIFPATAQPQDDGYFGFPQDDPIWCEAAEFLDRHVKPVEKIAAPNEFYEKIPQQFNLNTQVFLETKPNWVVVHKGEVQEMDNASLQWTTEHLAPVFANPVFIVFTNRSDLAKLSKRSPHIRSFLTMNSVSLLTKIWKNLIQRIVSY